MVAVNMRIDHEIDRRLGVRLDRLDDLVRKRLECIVDKYDAVVTGQEPEIAARKATLTFQHKQTVGDLSRFERDLCLLCEDDSA